MVPQVAFLHAGLPKGYMLQGGEQDIGGRAEPQLEQVGPDGMGGRPVSEQIHLAFLDPVFHVPACAVDMLIKGAWLGRCLRQGTDGRVTI